MTKDQMMEVARGNVERHLGDCEETDDIFEGVYILAFDALHDAGIPDEEAQLVAQELAMSYAQP